MDALELDALAADVHDRAQHRLQQLVRLLAVHDGVVADTTEPPPAPWRPWRPWRTGPAPRDTARLEQALEAAQRRVLVIGHQLDRIRAEAVLLEAELAAVLRCSSADDGPAARARRARVDELARIQRDFLALHERLADALERLHAAGEAELRALDASLGKRAAEAAARDLASAVGAASLDASVRRVHTAACEGRAVLAGGIDRLAAELSVLGIRDREWDAAEAEVVRTLDARIPRGR